MVLIGTFGFKQSGNGQGPGTSDDHANAITADIGRAHHRLKVGIGGLDAIGVNNNVLGGRGKTKGNRGKGHHGQVFCRVGQSHPQDGGDDAALGNDQPAAPTAQNAVQNWQGQTVNQWRPDKLEGIAKCRPTEIGNSGTIHTCFAQPYRQGGENQKDGNAGRQSQKQHRDHARMNKGPKGLAPASFFCAVHRFPPT